MSDDDRTPATVRLTLTIGRSPLPWNVRLKAALKALGRRWALLCTLVEFPDDAPEPPAAMVEQLAEALHAFWLTEWRGAGIRSRRSPDGEEFMLPWAELSEAAREFDRRGVRAVLAVLDRRRVPSDLPPPAPPVVR